MEESEKGTSASVWRQTLSVVIPARNEVESLPMMLQEISKTPDIDKVLIVDGHSTDGSADRVRELGFDVVPQRGRGYGMGVITGIEQAETDLVTFMDADGSYDPAALARMRDLVENENYDIVFCSRYLPASGSDDDTLIRFIGNMFFTKSVRILFGVKLTDILFFYALGRREVFENLGLQCADFSLCIEVPIKAQRLGYSYTEIPSRERPRVAGVSKVNAFWDGFRILGALLKLRFTVR